MSEKKRSNWLVYAGVGAGILLLLWLLNQKNQLTKGTKIININIQKTVANAWEPNTLVFDIKNYFPGPNPANNSVVDIALDLLITPNHDFGYHVQGPRGLTIPAGQTVHVGPLDIAMGRAGSYDLYIDVNGIAPLASDQKILLNAITIR